MPSRSARVPREVPRAAVARRMRAPAKPRPGLQRHRLHLRLADACVAQQPAHRALRTRPAPPPVVARQHHRCRRRPHACALHTLEATGDVRKVSLWLGHSSLQTTEMYLQADPTDKLDTLDKWRPPSLRKGTFKGV